MAVTHRRAQVRGDEPDQLVVEFRSGQTFRLMLTPAEPVDTPLGVRVYARMPETLDDIPLPAARQSASGSVMIEGVVGDDVRLPHDASHLLVVIGTEGSLPSKRLVDRLLAEAASVREESWAAWRIAVRIDE